MKKEKPPLSPHLKVPVYDPVLVQVGQASAHLLADVGDLPLREALLQVDDDGVEGAAVAVLDQDLKFQRQSSELGTWLDRNCISNIFLIEIVFLTFTINYFLHEAGCLSSPCPKEGQFQSWALAVFLAI